MKTKLNVGEIYGLEKELTGIRDQKTQATILKGLLSQELPGVQKYNLLDLLQDEITPNKEIVEKLQGELIKEYGVLDEASGGYSIPFYIDEVVDGEPVIDEKGEPKKVENPSLKEFNDKMEAILSQEKEISHEPFGLEYLEFKSTEVYPIFNKLVKSSKTQLKADK